MPELRNPVSTVRGTASTVRTLVGKLLYRSAVLGALAVWLLFWGNLARLHYTLGDPTSAAFTAALTLAPVIGFAVWYAGERTDVGLPSPSIDADILSS